MINHSTRALMSFKPDAMNPAMALRFAFGDQWRRVTDLERFGAYEYFRTNQPSRERNRNIMKRFLCYFFGGLVAFGTAILLSSCSPGGNSTIIGKWTESNGAVTEFRADGTCSIGDPKSPMTGKFKAGSDHVRIDLDGAVGQAVGKMDCKITAVQGESFDLTYPDGEVHHLKKTR
jgi:hypothetical protein